MNGYMQSGKAGAEVSQMSSPQPGRRLTSRLVGVFSCHEVSIHLHRLGQEACWIERPCLSTKRHT